MKIISVQLSSVKADKDRSLQEIYLSEIKEQLSKVGFLIEFSQRSSEIKVDISKGISLNEYRNHYKISVTRLEDSPSNSEERLKTTISVSLLEGKASFNLFYKKEIETTVIYTGERESSMKDDYIQFKGDYQSKDDQLYRESFLDTFKKISNH